MGVHHGQETGLKCDFDSIKKKWTFGSGFLLARGLGGGAKIGVEIEKNKDKSASSESCVTCVDVRCFLQTILE